MRAIEILFENKGLLVVRKDPGLLSQKNERGEPGLTDLLPEQVGGPDFPVHRLDRDTSGLIIAYREAAADALAHAEVETKQVEEVITYDFPYVMMNDVMRIVKDMQPRIISQTYENTCQIKLSIRQSEAEQLRQRLAKLSFS